MLNAVMLVWGLLRFAPINFFEGGSILLVTTAGYYIIHRLKKYSVYLVSCLKISLVFNQQFNNLSMTLFAG